MEEYVTYEMSLFIGSRLTEWLGNKPVTSRYQSQRWHISLAHTLLATKEEYFVFWA